MTKEDRQHIDEVKEYAKDLYRFQDFHGLAHAEMVSRIVPFLLVPEADEIVCHCFAYFHDICRVNNSYDPEHGERAARMVGHLRNSLFAFLNDEQIETLQTACRLHTNTIRTGNITIDICFDADRINLLRFGTQPEPERMATAKGKDFAGGKWEESKVIFDELIKNGEHPKVRSYLFSEIKSALDSGSKTRKELGEMIRSNHGPRMDREEFIDLIAEVGRENFMQPCEQQIYNGQPDIITLYRGTNIKEAQSGKYGVWWTTDLYVAASYSIYISSGERAILKAEIPKKYLSAIFWWAEAFEAHFIIDTIHNEINPEIFINGTYNVLKMTVRHPRHGDMDNYIRLNFPNELKRIKDEERKGSRKPFISILKSKVSKLWKR